MELLVILGVVVFGFMIVSAMNQGSQSPKSSGATAPGRSGNGKSETVQVNLQGPIQVVDDQYLVFRCDDPAAVTRAIPSSSETPEGLRVRWDYGSAKALAGLGILDVPSPILRDYVWTGRHKPFAHQKTTASFLSLREKAFCFNEQGTGKTASVIWAADYLMKLGKVGRVLVICPLSIMRAAWERDLRDFAPHLSCGIAHGAPQKRVGAINSGAEFVIINYDGVEVVKDEIVAGGFDLIVIDEANAYKNHDTNRWKTLNRIKLETNCRIWMLTGTPAAQSPVDAYGLARLADSPMCPQYFGVYRSSVMRPINKYKWVPKPEARIIVQNILQPAVRFEKKDCLDLPEVTFSDREAPLTPQQKRYYGLASILLYVESKDETISVVSAVSKINKLLQISSGAVYTDSKDVVEFDISNRLNVVMEVINESKSKALIFVPFTHTIQLLRDKITKEGITCEVINGEVSMERRAQTVTIFQEQPDPKVLIIQPKAASHGLTLTAADTIIWYAPITSVETYLQANARIDRPGQRNSMNIVHIFGSAVEEKIYSALRSKVDFNRALLDLFQTEMAEAAKRA